MGLYIAFHCNTLQHTVPHNDTLQHTATHCNTLQHTAIHCNSLQYTTIHRNTLQTVSSARCVYIRLYIHTTTHCNTLHHTATHCNTLQSKALQITCTSDFFECISGTLLSLIRAYFECTSGFSAYVGLRILGVSGAPLSLFRALLIVFRAF